ncbi:dihydrofolate reductase family protein [Mastigocoleus testarum]|uniref:Deaminase n=1 Tax=Mastigocoleus testarum BC008 TaxID=371196 RepID=A0A0V7ZFW7_9CYAN|nr:dihydrofolate reductase family protein [Mastigocoleus testarum]KST63411.1 deaminase [Mastigocoleus testarum BC008]
MRKLKYYVACSIDGFIAREDGSFDCFPFDNEVVADYLESLKSFDVVLMGRKTYEVGLKEGKTDPYPNMKSYVFSRTMRKSPDERVQLISDNVPNLVRNLKNETGKDIYLCGGADLAATLFAENLIDEVILKLNPFLMGSGIPLFGRAIEQTTLELTNSKIYRSGIILLNYQVMHFNK